MSNYSQAAAGKGLGKQSQHQEHPQSTGFSSFSGLSPWDARGGVRSARNKSALHGTAPQNGHRERGQEMLELSSALPLPAGAQETFWDGPRLRRIQKCQIPHAFFPIKMDLIQPQIKFLRTSLEMSMSAKKIN